MVYNVHLSVVTTISSVMRLWLMTRPRPGPMLMSMSPESVTITGFRQCRPLITIRRGFAEPVNHLKADLLRDAIRLLIWLLQLFIFFDSNNFVTTKRSIMDMNVPFCNSMIYNVWLFIRKTYNHNKIIWWLCVKSSS